jgi:outer membrane lipoprotein LolB
MTRAAERFFSLTVLATLLTGCAHTPPVEDPYTFVERRSVLESLDGWDLSGRIAVNTGERAFQGRFRWRQIDDTLDLSIRGPLGTGILEIAGPTGGLTVNTRGETLSLTDPETELSQLMGWWLPVESFSAWLLGLPDPTYPATTSFDPDDRLRRFEQRLWQVSYESYQVAQGMVLPERIDLAHRDLELRVTVDRWESIDAE